MLLLKEQPYKKPFMLLVVKLFFRSLSVTKFETNKREGLEMPCISAC